MDYTHIRLTGLNSIDLAIQDAQHDDLFIMKGMDGFGVEVGVSIAKGLAGEGYFQNKVPSPKQLVTRIGLNPYWNAVGGTPSDLRELLYGMLTGGYEGDRVSVILLNIDPVSLVETEVCRIYGYVSKFETVPFSKDPQVQITIECLSPYFELNTYIWPDLETLSTTTPTIVNEGSGPTGFYAKWTFSGLSASLPWFEIQAQGGLRKMRFDPPANFANFHSIEVSTEPGNRFVRFWQGVEGVYINGLPWLTTDSEWLQFYGGTNVLTTSNNHFTWDEFQYKPKWWGV